MTGPVLVEVLRGGRVESVHRGVAVVVDADGHTLLAIGDVDRPVFPRSAVKAIQALPFVESGAADAYGFGESELALACASHGGEPEHVALASAMLSAAGLDEPALECGVHWPSHFPSSLRLARDGVEPRQTHNNCSGKHAGFLCTCTHLGIGHRGYVAYGHASQEMVREAMETVTGARHDADNMGVDGCSIPTYAVPLGSLALGFARMATGQGLAPQRSRAATRLLAACMAKPFLVAGTDRADTKLMEAAPGRIFVKTGAEGVYCGALPELGLGIALKCDDGGERAAAAILAGLLARLLASEGDLSGRLWEMARAPILNRKGVAVGALRLSGELEPS